MNDYKELIEVLRGGAEWAEANIYQVPVMLPTYLEQAADAIEQIVKERDAAIAIIEELSEMDYCHNFQLSDDWVVDFIHKITKMQKKAKEWRGVQE